MFEHDNGIYYERRKAQAMEQGDRATDPKIASLHYELALRYAILSVQGTQLDRERTCSTPKLVRALSMADAGLEMEKALQA